MSRIGLTLACVLAAAIAGTGPVRAESGTLETGFDIYNQPSLEELIDAKQLLAETEAYPEPVRAELAPASVAAIEEAMTAQGLVEAFTVPDFPLPNGSRTKLMLQAVPMWAGDASIAVMAGEKVAFEGRPQAKTQLIGIAVDDQSTGVQFRMTANGLSGFLYSEGQLFQQTVDGSTITFTPGMPAEEVPVARLTPEDYVSMLEPAKELSHEDLLAGFCCVGGPASMPFKFFDLAVVTDDELYQRYPSLIAIQALVEDLVAALNVAYFGDTGVLFRLRWLGMYGPFQDQGMTDPFNGRFDDGVVRELHDVWAPAWTHVPRDLVVLFSGKFLGGNKIFMPWKCVGGPRDGQWCDLFQPRDYAACGSGSCQWVGPSICDIDRSMAVIGIGNSRDSNINKLAHEVGHLFGAEHAHCTQDPATGRYVDRCQSGATNLRGQACYNGMEYGPASRQSSIMSYCGPPTYPYTFRFDPINANAINAAAAASSCARNGTVTELTSGTAVTGLDSTSNGPGYTYFSIDVPTGALRLEITTSGGSGDLMLFARHGTLPTTWGTRKSDRPGTTAQNILVTNPGAGTWYILFFSLNQFSNVTLNAEFQ